MAGQIQSIVQEARHIGTEISIGELLAKDREVSVRQNQNFPRDDKAL
jgi:hypothetical protein